MVDATEVCRAPLYGTLIGDIHRYGSAFTRGGELVSPTFNRPMQDRRRRY
jgi:hypothetical protein